MYCIPKKNKRAAILSLILNIFGIILVALSKFLPYAWLFQLLSIVMITSGIQLLVRFTLCEYKYSIDDLDDGNSDLIIWKTQGARKVKVCHMSLSNVEEICIHGEKKVEASKRYNYTQNIGERAESIVFSDGEKLVEVIIEASDSFISAVKERSGKGDGTMNFVM